MSNSSPEENKSGYLFAKSDQGIQLIVRVVFIFSFRSLLKFSSIKSCPAGLSLTTYIVRFTSSANWFAALPDFAVLAAVEAFSVLPLLPQPTKLQAIRQDATNADNNLFFIFFLLFDRLNVIHAVYRCYNSSLFSSNFTQTNLRKGGNFCVSTSRFLRARLL